VVTRRVPGAFTVEVVDLLRTFATQSALAIQNARLFRELADKSRQLEVASQHKSEFLANMSHELRTTLSRVRAAPRRRASRRPRQTARRRLGCFSVRCCSVVYGTGSRPM